MIGRLRTLLLILTPLYTSWTGYYLIIGRVPPWSGLTILGEIAIGSLLGALAVFLSDNDSRHLHWRDGMVNALFFTIISLLFATFALQGTTAYTSVNFFGEVTVDQAGFLRYLWSVGWRGTALGALLWVLVAVNVGFIRRDLTGYTLAAFATTIALITAPFAANALFNGALFVVVAIGIRLTLLLMIPWISVWWQGFIFGVVAGMLAILIPFVGYFAFGIL